MKKLFLIAALLLGLAGSVFAAAIPESVDPQTGGPEVWLQSVYNNGATTLDVGDVVVWDGDSSTGDDDNWVETTTTADTYLVAGVVYPSDIVAGGRGTIAIRGPVQTDAILGSLSGVAGLACSSGTAGAAKGCSTEAANFGVVTQVNSGTSAIVCVHCNH